MIYRREIDGLRALAVLPVILFHAGFSTVSGGFVGVDVFFVISGFLITSIIVEELAAGKFTLAGFYERRARRILPALFFVLLACLPFAWWLLLPAELVDFGKSVMAVAVSASNLLFWLQTDYFAATAEQIPLLHTWSLAVEEQYYLVFPLIMVLAWGLGKRWLVVVLALVALLSLAWSEWLWRSSVEANFYLIPSRAWELMVGALAAFYLQNKVLVTNGIMAQIASVFGLVLLGYAVFFFDEGMPFPSVYALVPTLGAVLLIVFATPATWVGQLLVTRPLVWVGLISYSAYLWHQPVFVFARLQALEEPSVGLMAGLCIITLGLAWFSWRFVEQPFRDRHRFTRTQIFSAAVIGSLLFIALGAGLVWTDGLASRFAD
ncbi:Peptidoglycan/LPS O-acetylase OafA/YrhL, contains acyltransferase and SGNH-hydrolase domains [Thiothrix caldifontis]|uniref:Peptidoglycan/LPS O-acetylase OafA/YrhL, contains acyltransferase and SGNH-hydrolase domains n=1 Tax=Thiothrix caldifontis TaxID=525918 RepID=A0A1H4GCS8_9GAMM|nr:acyltransferase [Thiothrix caldifontis]SEB07415.1 Peptidoglycan/LPS O-acetylase OafA/YrhL, contains acyltransferase and SGNH-hydrolase domains [Thiothrix caldifontis]